MDPTTNHYLQCALQQNYIGHRLCVFNHLDNFQQISNITAQLISCTSNQNIWGGGLLLWIGPVVTFLSCYTFTHVYEQECDTGCQNYCKNKTFILCQSALFRMGISSTAELNKTEQ